MPRLIQVTINPDMYLVPLKQKTMSHIADLRNTIRAIEDESYLVRVAYPRPKAMVQIQLNSAVIKPTDAINEACSQCFLNLIRAFIAYLDEMIALKQVMSTQITLTSGISTQEELKDHINSILKAAYKKVAKDRSMSSPKKIEEFPSLPRHVRNMALSYFSLRACLEHHSSTPAEDIRAIFPKMVLLADEEEIGELPYEAKAGTAIKVRLDYSDTVFPANQEILLTEAHAEAVYFAIAMVLGPSVKAGLP